MATKELKLNITANWLAEMMLKHPPEEVLEKSAEAIIQQAEKIVHSYEKSSLIITQIVSGLDEVK